MTKNHDEIEQEFFEAAGALLQDGFERCKERDIELFAAVDQCVKAGSKMALIVTFDKNGVLSLTCKMEQPDGGALELFRLDPRGKACPH